MTDGPADFDDDLLDDLADVAELYPPGVLPGLHRVELVTATFTGFSAHQARAVLADDALAAWLWLYWAQHPPRARIHELAAEPSVTGALHQRLLDAFAQASPVIRETEAGESAGEADQTDGLD